MREKMLKTYYCDFCNKHFHKRPTAETHEEFCSRNPINIDRSKCFKDCQFLIHNKKEYHVGYQFDGSDIYRTYSNFHCSKLDQDMYSYIVNKWEHHPAKEEGIEMPRECEHFISKF